LKATLNNPNGQYELTIKRVYKPTKSLLTERKPTANSTLAIGGVSSSLDSFVVNQSLVLRINICAEKPAHRQYVNCWRQA